MKKDIESRADIEAMVDCFYHKVKSDELLSPIFTMKIPVTWATHLPVMYQFWENAIFFTGGYLGNPMEMHAFIHKKVGLETVHFDRWVLLFNQAVDESFEGPKANIAKQKAFSIAKVMEQKILLP
jgi:hemoglobin